jgi:hypothetical protein
VLLYEISPLALIKPLTWLSLSARDTAPELPPPVKPLPAVTAVMSAALSLAIVMTLPLFVTLMFVPPCIVTFSVLLTFSAEPPPESVSNLQ